MPVSHLPDRPARIIALPARRALPPRALGLAAAGLAALGLVVPQGAEAADRRQPLRVTGQLVDPPAALERIIERHIGPTQLDSLALSRLLSHAADCARTLHGEINRSAANAPASAQPIGLVERLRTLISVQLGYCVEHTQPDGPRVAVRLRRYRVVRKVSIAGNWPIFEEEFRRRLTFRPGQRLPEGKALAHAIAAQQLRLKQFLSRRGYFDGSLKITVNPADEQGRVNVDVRVDKGKSYKVGVVRVEPMASTGGEDADKWQPAVPRPAIEDIFRDWVLFYQRNFNTERFKKHGEALVSRYHRLGYPGMRLKATFAVNPKLPSNKAVEVLLKIQQRKQIDLHFRGASAISEKKLRQALTLFEAGAYDDYELSQSAAKMHKLYQGEGYQQARVRFTRVAGPQRDTVTFHINEGPRFRVRSIRFSGNRPILAKQLRKQIRTRTYPTLGLGEGGYLTRTQLLQDSARIARFYRARGHMQARVEVHVAPHPKLLAKPAALAAAVGSGAGRTGELHVLFKINKGPVTSVKRVDLHGAQAVSAQQLRSRLAIQPGTPFSLEGLKQARTGIVQVYAEHGYLYATVDRPVVGTWRGDPHQRRIRFSITEGKRVRLGPILLRGNSVTRPSVIRSALGLEEGELFDIRKLELGEQRLRNTGIFDAVRIQVIGSSAQLSRVPLVVTVEERHDDYGAIELGVGGSTDNFVFGSVGYDWRNAFGLGANIRVRGEVGPEIQSGTLDALYPRALGSEFGTELRLFVRNEVTERLGHLSTFGGAFTVSREIVRYLRAFLTYQVRQVETREPLFRPAGDFDEASQAQVTTRTGSLSTRLVYDKRDSFLAPTRGMRFSATLVWAARALFGTDDFLAVRLNGQAYIPLPLDMTIAIGARYDHGIPLGGAHLLPRVERFFAGGDTTIRGFEEDRASVERVDAPLSPIGSPTYVRLIPQGGNIRVLTNVEFQFPIWKKSILLGLPLMGAVFFDNGVVTNSFHGFEMSQFRHGLGGALRIVTLAGFLSVEYAFPLDPEVGDPADGRFHLNFGFIF